MQSVYNHVHIVPCWRYLLGLQNTPLCLWHSFIYDSTSRYYNLSLNWVQTPWCLVSGRFLDVFSSRRLAANWLLVVTCNLSTIRDWLGNLSTIRNWFGNLSTIRDWLGTYLTHSGCRDPSLNICADRIEHTLSHSWSSIATSWLLRRCPTFNGIRCHGDVLSFRGNTLILSLTVRCSGNVLSFRCPGDGLQYSRFQAWFTESLPSDGRHCLPHSENHCVGSVNPSQYHLYCNTCYWIEIGW
jgi:hypothetical protein